MNIQYHDGGKCEQRKDFCAEYIWLDGRKPTAGIRAKGKILKQENGEGIKSYNPPLWAFDGSSTDQAEGHISDCLLQPVRMFYDPLRNIGKEQRPHILVLCEVLNRDRTSHPSNTRAPLRECAERLNNEEFWFGVEQEYTLFKDERPLGFPRKGRPERDQGPYYCSVGTGNAFGRELVEEHIRACRDAGILLEGWNAEVMPGQWEWQIGHTDPLTVADHLVVSRYLMHSLGEKRGIVVSFDPKPLEHWNGAGAHTNFSTKTMREEAGKFEAVIKRLREKHAEHIEVYGEGIEKRLTGQHETCSYKEFRAGALDRGASIRIPVHCAEQGRGYLEDRRPCANIDPYVVFRKIMETVSGI